MTNPPSIPDYGLPPQAVFLLAFLGIVSLLAVLVIALPQKTKKKYTPHLIVPHPSRPISMLVFSALPTFLTLVTFVHRGVFTVLPILRDPVNRPYSSNRIFDRPRGVQIETEKVNGHYHVIAPQNTADLTVNAAVRVSSGSRRQRIQAIRDLAWWTCVCPNYAPFTIPRLTSALRDSDPAVKGVAAIELGSTGGHGATAIPALKAARGTSVKYLNYLIDEAVFLIEQSPKWPPEDVCEDVSTDELERRAVQQGHEPDET